MYNPVEVCWFDNAMTGAPSLPGNTAGALITVLDACLVNGFNTQTLTSLVVSGGVATATKTSHGFWDHTVVLIAGATPADLNGKKRITLVDADSFTFEAVGIANGTATGTILAKMAPAGWTKTGSSTYAYYTKPSPMSTPWACLIDDTVNGYALIAGRHTSGSTFYGYGGYTYISKGSQTPLRDWSVYADGRAVYIFVNYSGTEAAYPASWRLSMLGDLVAFKNSDDNACLLLGPNGNGGAGPMIEISGSNATYTGSTLAPGAQAWRVAQRLYNISYSGYGTSLIDGDAASDGCFHCTPIEVWGAMYSDPRGIIAGCFSSLHDWNCVANGTILTNPQYTRVPQLTGHRIRVLKAAANGMVVMDITGPWYPTDRYYGLYRIRGTAKKQGAVGRFPLALIVKNSGQIIRKTMSAADGTYAFNNIDYLYEGYIVAEFDGEITDPLNAAIADLVTPEAMP